MDDDDKWLNTKMMDRRWWRCGDNELGDAVWMSFEVAKTHDIGRRDAYAQLRNMYETGLTGDEIESADPDTSSHVSRDNVIASIIDTARSKLLEQRPVPMCLTAGGDMTMRLQAERLTAWTKEACAQIGLHRCMEAAWVDAMICGSGAVRIFERDGRPAVEQAFCEDIFIDPLEASQDTVMTYYQMRVIDRTVLAGMFPEQEKQIKNASASTMDDMTAEHLSASDQQSTADMVTVVLAWRVAPSSDQCGRHVVVLHGGQASNVVLLDEEYHDERAPFVFLHYRNIPRRFWGAGLAAMLAPIQVEIDNLGDIIDRTLDSFVPQVWLREGTAKVKEITDETGMYYTFSGDPPIFFDPSAQACAGQRIWQEQRMQRAYQLAGISSTEAGAMKEAGLDSGKALRVHQDIKSQRLMAQHRVIEDAYKDAFRRVIDVADAIVEGVDADGEKSDEETKEDRMRYLAGDGERLEELSFSDVRIRDAMFKIEIFTVSKLSESPAARLQEVMELMNAGLLQGDEAMDALDFPDVKGISTLRSATSKWAKLLVERAIMGEAGPNDVTSMDDLQTIVTYGTIMHSKARMDGADVQSLESLRQMIARATTFLTPPQPAAAEQAGPPPGPGGPPVPAGPPAAPPPGMPGEPPMM